MPYSDPIPALKQQLAAELVRIMNGRNAADVASLMRTDAPRVIDIRKGRLERFSVESLIRFLTRLRCRVKVVVEVATRLPGCDRADGRE